MRKNLHRQRTGFDMLGREAPVADSWVADSWVADTLVLAADSSVVDSSVVDTPVPAVDRQGSTDKDFEEFGGLEASLQDGTNWRPSQVLVDSSVPLHAAPKKPLSKRKSQDLSLSSLAPQFNC
jgi:hypothetical protein